MSSSMIIGIPKEKFAGESRVAASPESIKKLLKLGYQVQVESGCGTAASFPDSAYEAAGAQVLSSAEIWTTSDIIFKVRAPAEDEIESLRQNDRPHKFLFSLIWPAQNQDLLQRLSDAGVSTLAMDCVPRISRAQKLDVLSSMANIAGYRAIIEAANSFGSFFTGQMTAAGKVPPAKVLIIGAGVAGLAAIGTARGLGAIVRAFDTRPTVKEQVQSMGADFLELEFEEDGEGDGGYAKVMSQEFIDAEMALFAAQAKDVDIIVTTALVPGKPAPKLITEKMIQAMKPGSVVVDLAAEQGGNCELTVPDQRVVKHGVTIIGYTDLPSRLPTQSSRLYANNLVNLISDMSPEKNGEIVVDREDEVIVGCLVTHQDQITWPPPKSERPPVQPAAAKPVPEVATKSPETMPSTQGNKLTALVAFVVAIILLVGMGLVVPAEFVSRFTVFILACFVGWQVVWNVNPALHTPLMSVTNAISGIIVVGAVLQIFDPSLLVMTLSAFGIFIASINIAGGFWVTNRMLNMFRKQD